MQVGLDHRAGLREVLAQLVHRRQRAIGRRVVLHVDGDRCVSPLGSGADLPGEVESDSVAIVGEGLAQGAEFEADLGGPEAAQIMLTEQVKQGHVGIPRRLGLVPIHRVFAEEVDRRKAVGVAQLGRGAHGILDVGARHIAGDDTAADRRLFEGVADQRGLGEPEQGSPEDISGFHGFTVSPRRAGPTPPSPVWANESFRYDFQRRAVT